MVKPIELASGSYWQVMGQRLGNNGEVIMDIPETLFQVYGKVHGGAIAGLMDSAIAVAINTSISENQGAATIELKLNYLHPVSGRKLIARGEIINKGKMIAVGEGRIWDEDGNLVALGTATFRLFNRNDNKK